VEAVAAAVVLSILASLVVVLADPGSQFYERETPWDLKELSGRLVVIAGGLAGFAVTGMVLLVTLAKDRAESRSDSFDATVFMFLTAYLFLVSAAFLFAFMPRADADGKQPARIQFALAANLMFRSVMIAWLQSFGLDVLADFSGGALTFSVALGGVFLMAILYGIGVITLRESILLPTLSTIVWLLAALLAIDLLPELKSPKSSLYLTAALYGLNVLTFFHFCLGLLAGMFERVRIFSVRYSRDVSLIDTQSTMILLAFLWMAVMGIL
jgi:hypothetical protein